MGENGSEQAEDRRHTMGRIAVLICLLLTPAGRTLSQEWPALPVGSGSMEIPAQVGSSSGAAYCQNSDSLPWRNSQPGY